MNNQSRLFALCLTSLLGAACQSAWAGPDDVMHLTDQPGNWFRSERTGGPLSIIDPGQRVDFVINNCCTGTRHTVTLLVKPEGSRLQLDQDASQRGTLSAEFDLPGVYVIVCKVHPYMTAVVAVRNARGAIPDVRAQSLPFIGHLGASSLPATTVLSVMTTVAPTDADKIAKWQIFSPIDAFRPAIPGVGEIWVDTQFERVPGQVDEHGVVKPGTITVVDAATFAIEREINGLTAGGLWNNPHNIWANFSLDTIYNSNWFGQSINKIDRATGRILDSIRVGEAPTHIITIPTPGSGQVGVLTVPLSADDKIVKVEDTLDGLKIIDAKPTGVGRNHPHGHWLTCGLGDRVVVPNVFKGLGMGGSISVMDTISGTVLQEFGYEASDPLRSALLMPIAAGECHVNGVHKAYVANLASGLVSVINVDSLTLLRNISVTLTPDGLTGLGLLDTLQVPIQTPVSPDERWVATAVLSLTTVPRSTTGSPDHVAIIDTATDQVVKYVPVPAGAHGVNWGPKLGGGYYAYVTCQHSNAMVVIDPDPNSDGHGNDAAVVGRIVLSNGSANAGVTDGTGGQGVKPLPLSHDGWIQPTVAMVGTGRLSPEVEGWIAKLTPSQRNPDFHHEHFVGASLFEVIRGTVRGGGLPELAAGDDRLLELGQANAGDSSIQAVFEGFSPRETLASLTFSIEGRATGSNAVGLIELFDFVADRWVGLQKFEAGPTDTRTVADAGSAPGRFIRTSDRRMRTRITWISQNEVTSWGVGVDHVVWEIHH